MKVQLQKNKINLTDAKQRLEEKIQEAAKSIFLLKISKNKINFSKTKPLTNKRYISAGF